MRKQLLKILSVLVLASLALAACAPAAPATLTKEDVAEIVAVEVAKAVSTANAIPAPTATPEPTDTPSNDESMGTVEAAAFPKNDLVNPVLFDAGEDPAGEADPGLFDIGVNADQVAIVFGWDLSWNGNTIPGEGCEMTVLGPGWYENFQILDGRYEIYTLPSSDPAGWREVLVEQRVAEQATHYSCPATKTPPTWGE